VSLSNFDADQPPKFFPSNLIKSVHGREPLTCIAFPPSPTASEEKDPDVFFTTGRDGFYCQFKILDSKAYFPHLKQRKKEIPKPKQTK